jgi:ribonucleoside-triphosphate reductase (thioredoxin)
MEAPKWGPTGREIYERTYSRTKADGAQETWLETVERVVDGNLALVPEQHIMPGERRLLIDAIYNFKILPAGRHLWTSGVPGKQFNRNCHRAGWTERLSDHFTFMFDELMKGGGVGANYSQEYVRLAGWVLNEIDLRVQCDPTHPDAQEVNPDPLAKDFPASAVIFLKAQDSREGWVEVLRNIIDLATATEVAPHMVIYVDVSQVRPRGSILRGFGGTASGPGPLVEALRSVVAILNKAAGRFLTGVEAMAIDHAVAQCVVAGNIRRSARMSIMHWRDPEIFAFINCKADHLGHWTTNISVEIDNRFFEALERRDPHAVAVFDAVVDGMLSNGEPGFFNSSLASEEEESDVRCTNPCGEIALEEWESCNLGHVNLAAFDLRDDEDTLVAFVLMARFLVRATFAELLDQRQRAVENRNRRIGVGIFGFQEWLVKAGIKYSAAADDLEVAYALDLFRMTAINASNGYAIDLGIPLPIKHTTVAPTGTIAKLPGVTEGIHPIYARYFERRVRYDNGDPLLAELIAQGYETEPCVYNPNTTVVVFHVRDPLVDVAPRATLVEQTDEISVEQKLAVQRMVQEVYADNAVSYTINLAQDVTREELVSALLKHLPYVKGTTVFPANTRPQSPYTAISREEYLAATDHTVSQSFDECASGACPVR